MILNSVRAKSAKVCPEAHFPFVRSLLPSLPLLSSLSQWRRRDQPTHIDITLLFPKAPARLLPSLPFFFPLFGIIGLLLCPNFPQGGRRRENCGCSQLGSLLHPLLEASHVQWEKMERLVRDGIAFCSELF